MANKKYELCGLYCISRFVGDLRILYHHNSTNHVVLQDWVGSCGRLYHCLHFAHIQTRGICSQCLTWSSRGVWWVLWRYAELEDRCHCEMHQGNSWPG